MADPYIPSWLTADSNGGLKLISCKPSPSTELLNLKEPALKHILDAQIIPTATAKPIHRLAVGTHADQNMIAIARADATTFLCDGDKLSEGFLSQIKEWTEPTQRFNTTQGLQDTWIGLDICSPGVLQCSQKGKARLTSINADSGDLTSHTCNLPVNLRHCKTSPSGSQFAYAGTEVNLSVWNTEAAFHSGSASSSVGDKRARKSDQLFPGEIWRAKNVPHDSLDLRQPVNITSLEFLSVNESGSHHTIAVGNTLGCVHTFDTRKGRKPAFSWSDSRMSGGISLVEKGIRENELLVADCGTQLWTIDTRKPSAPLYAYKGLSGKVTSFAASPSSAFSVAGSLDRYFRLLGPGAPSEGSGGVVGRLYVTSAPTAIVPVEVPRHDIAPDGGEGSDGQGEEDEDWGDIQPVSSDDEDASHIRKKRRKKD